MLKFSGMPGNRKVFDQISKIPQSMAKGLKRGGLLAGKDIRHEIRRKLAAPKHGRIYILNDIWTGRPLRHRASAPGEAPARFSGSLKASVNYIARVDELIIGAGTGGKDVGIVYDAGYPSIVDLSGQIGFGRIVDYAAKLELRMNRPYLRVTVLDRQKNTYNYLGRSFLRELQI